MLKPPNTVESSAQDSGQKVSTDKSQVDRCAIEFHNTLASSWEQNYASKSFRARLGALDRLLDKRDLRGKQWLDAGCGTGTLSRWLAGRGAIVVGVDASDAMVRTAAALSIAHPCHRQMRFNQIGTIEMLEMSASSLDGVLCSSVLEYLENPGHCLAGFHRVLQEGGLLVISVPNAKSMFRKALRFIHGVTDTWPHYMRYSRNQYSRTDFETLLSNYGFLPLNSIVLGGPFPTTLQRKESLGNLIMFMAEKRSGARTEANCDLVSLPGTSD